MSRSTAQRNLRSSSSVTQKNVARSQTCVAATVSAKRTLKSARRENSAQSALDNEDAGVVANQSDADHDDAAANQAGLRKAPRDCQQRGAHHRVPDAKDRLERRLRAARHLVHQRCEETAKRDSELTYFAISSSSAESLLGQVATRDATNFPNDSPLDGSMKMSAMITNACTVQPNNLATATTYTIAVESHKPRSEFITRTVTTNATRLTLAVGHL